MPELPEVETVRRMVSPHLIGREIIHIAVTKPIINNISTEDFIHALTGDVFVDTSRCGKYLVFSMKSGKVLVLHLRMTGCLIAAPTHHPYEPHTHVIFHLDDDWELRFSDTRRFGRFWLFNKGESLEGCGIEKLGPEPWDDLVTGAYLKYKVGSSSRSIKDCLLDQSVIAGIGNIYSDEILFKTGILPTRKAETLTDCEWDLLADNIGECMRFFLIKNMISDEDYINGHGKDYRNTPFLSVYGKSGEPCPCCGTTLSRCVVGQRGSVFCKRCQN